MIRRRNIALFSLSFLDCICCGFGAIILLFVLTMGSQTIVLRDVRERMQRIYEANLVTLQEFTTKKEELKRATLAHAQVIDETKKEETLKALLEDLDRQIQNQQAGKQALLVEMDQLKKEIAPMQKKPELVLPDVEPLPVGVPVGSNYLVFVIDTSGSMRDQATLEIWPVVIRKIEEVLDSYPIVKGIQLLDADGRFMLGRGEQWLPDSPDVRDAMKSSVRRYGVASYSNPVPGILQAFRRLYEPQNEDMKMGIYIFGDEFSGGRSDDVIRRLNELNPADEEGNRRVVINAVGFPTAVRFGISMANTGVRFANLMREIAHQHGGAFIAVQDL